MASIEIDVSGTMNAPQIEKPGSTWNLPLSLPPSLGVWVVQRRENIRPWTSFANTGFFKPAPSLPRLSKRVVRNIEYFQIFCTSRLYNTSDGPESDALVMLEPPNEDLIHTKEFKTFRETWPFFKILKPGINFIKYGFTILYPISDLFTINKLLTSPLLLLVVTGCLFVCYRLSSRKLSLGGKELSMLQRYTLVAVASTPLLYWSGAGAAVFWVLGASCFVIILHAAFFNIEALLQEDDNFDLLQAVV